MASNNHHDSADGHSPTSSNAALLAVASAVSVIVLCVLLFAGAFAVRALVTHVTNEDITTEIEVQPNVDDVVETPAVTETPMTPLVSDFSMESDETDYQVTDPAEWTSLNDADEFSKAINEMEINPVPAETDIFTPNSFAAPSRQPQPKVLREPERVFAFTLEQWTLPADEEIVHAEIRHWDDEASLFRRGSRLLFDHGRLKIDTDSSGLGQPTPLFQLDGDRHFVSIASKWEIDQKADWLLVQTDARTYLLALGREPSKGISNKVDCDVFIETEPVGSDEMNDSDYERSADGGLVQAAISTFRAKHIVEGNHHWKTVPPFSQSQLIIDGECLPWDEVQRSRDGLSYDLSVTSQGEWNVAVEDPDAMFIDEDSESFYLSRSRRLEIRHELQRIKIRSILSIRLTSTLDDRMSGRLSRTYDDEISERSRALLQSRMRRFNSPRSANGKTSPYDLQGEDIAYLEVTWFHTRMTKVTEQDATIPNTVDVHAISRLHPIVVTVGVPEVRFSDGTDADDRIQSKQLVFSEIQIQCL